MKVNAADFTKAVKAIDKYSTKLGIPSNLQLSGSYNKLQVASLGVDYGARFFVKGVGDFNLDCFVETKRLLKLVKNFKKGFVEISIEEDKLTFEIGKTKATLPTVDLGIAFDWGMPSIKGSFEFHAYQSNELIDLFKKIHHYVSRDESREHLRQVLCTQESSTQSAMIATDGHRLAKFNFSYTFREDTLINGDALALAAKTMPKKTHFEIGESGGIFFLRSEKCEYWVKPARDLTFPPWERVIPYVYDSAFRADKTQLIEFANMVKGVTEHVNSPIVLDIYVDKVVCRNCPGDDCELTRDIEVDIITKQVDQEGVWVNAEYLIEALRDFPEDCLRFEFQSNLDPLKVEDPQGNIIIIMPVRPG